MPYDSVDQENQVGGENPEDIEDGASVPCFEMWGCGYGDEEKAEPTGDLMPWGIEVAHHQRQRRE